MWYNLYILASDQKQLLFFRATFEQLSLQKAAFDCFLSNFLGKYGKRFGKYRATFGKLGSELNCTLGKRGKEVGGESESVPSPFPILPSVFFLLEFFSRAPTMYQNAWNKLEIFARTYF